jgi:aryl-alcohol dehydrogenase
VARRQSRNRGRTGLRRHSGLTTLAEQNLKGNDVSVTTLGAVSSGPDELFDLREIVVEAPVDDEILVKVLATGICHTDMFFKGLLPAEMGPVLLGHEGAGVVDAVGPAVEGVRPGDHVVLTFNSCGHCRQCEAGRSAYCEQTALLNALGHRPGGSPRLYSAGVPVLGNYFGQSSFAGYALANARNTIVVDPDIDLSVVAAVGCGFQTGAGAVLNVLSPPTSARLVIYGTGSVGFAALLAAKSAGVATIVAVDPQPRRRELAAEFGAVAIDPTCADAASQIREATGGGATHGLDTTGRPNVISAGLMGLAPTGVMVVLGLGASELTINVQDMLIQGKTLRGCIEGESQVQTFIPHLIDLFSSGQFPIDRLVTSYRPEDINTAIADQAAGTVIKPVLIW